MDFDVMKILQVLRIRWWIIALTTVVFGVAAFLYSQFMITPKYTATATLYVLNTQNRQVDSINLADLNTAVRLVDTYVVVMKSDLVMGEVARRVDGGYSAAAIRSMFSASSEGETEILRINIENADPVRAKQIVDAILEVAPKEIIRVIKAGTVETLDAATVPTSPSSPNKRKNAITGAIVGMLLSLAIILLIELANTQVKEERDLMDMFALPIIGAIPNLQFAKPKRKGESVS